MDEDGIVALRRRLDDFASELEAELGDGLRHVKSYYGPDLALARRRQKSLAPIAERRLVLAERYREHRDAAGGDAARAHWRASRRPNAEILFNWTVILRPGEVREAAKCLK